MIYVIQNSTTNPFVTNSLPPTLSSTSYHHFITTPPLILSSPPTHSSPPQHQPPTHPLISTHPLITTPTPPTHSSPPYHHLTTHPLITTPSPPSSYHSSPPYSHHPITTQPPSKANTSFHLGLRFFLFTLVVSFLFLSGSSSILTYGSEVPEKSFATRSHARNTFQNNV